jgi:hypothetical protein
MLLFLASLLLLAALVIGFVVVRKSLKSGDDKAATADLSAHTEIEHSNVREDTKAVTQEAFDPAATQLYMRPPLSSPSAVQPKREGTAIAGARLVGLSGSQKGKSFAVAAAGITVGRNATCDVILTDPRVSGNHAWVGLVEGKAVLRDLKSTNGTFLNTNTKTTVTETELCSSDTIFFGGHQGDQFKFVAE